MSAATALLDVGRLALVSHHGEGLTWHPASVVFKRENGEVVTNEAGEALVLDASQLVSFEGNFDNAYQTISALDGSIASTGPAVTDVALYDLPSAARGDLVIRDGVQYSVLDVQPDGLGMVVLILSKNAH